MNPRAGFPGLEVVKIIPIAPPRVDSSKGPPKKIGAARAHQQGWIAVRAQDM